MMRAETAGDVSLHMQACKHASRMSVGRDDSMQQEELQ